MSYNFTHALPRATRAVAVCMLAACLVGCTSSNQVAGSQEATAEQTYTTAGTLSYAAATPLDTSDMFSDRDQDASWDENSTSQIDLAQEADDSGCVTISAEGTYVLTGELSGSIVVNAEDANVHLVLDGVQVSCDGGTALQVVQAKNVVVTLADGSENSLTSTGTFAATDEGIDGAIYSADDLSFNGSGSLVVTCEAGKGITCNDDLVFCGGTYRVTAADHAIDANDSVRISGGTFDLTAGNDGIHAECANDTTKGFVYIAAGSLTTSATGDGIQASSTLQVDGGNVSVTCTGDPEQVVDATTGDTLSTHALKADGDVVVLGGAITATSNADTVHATGNIGIGGGSLTLSAGDDGIHADADLTIEGGTVAIEQSNEGLEGMTINLYGGDTTVVATDDGINAAGDTEMGDYQVNIADGTLTVTADGDGIDSNGTITVSGGTTFVTGPTNDGNGALDYASTATITGGTFVACGSSGMATGFSTESTQAHALVSLGATTSDTMVLTDASGNELVSFAPGRIYSSVVVSCPDMQEDGTYTIGSTSFTLSGLSYSNGGGMGAMSGDMGGAPQGGGDMPGGGMGPMGNDMEGGMGTAPQGGMPSSEDTMSA